MKKEMMTLVDKNDNLVGYKERGTLDYDKDIYRVTGLRLENSKGEVLIAQRSFSKKNQGGVRGPAVAGTVNNKENYEQNILKESMEEIGLKLDNYELGPKEFIKSSNQNRKYFCQWFLATTDKKISDFILQEEEVAAVQRISKAKLLQRVKDKPEEFTSTANDYIKLFCN